MDTTIQNINNLRSTKMDAFNKINDKKNEKNVVNLGLTIR
jgi:hypothetical protein